MHKQFLSFLVVVCYPWPSVNRPHSCSLTPPLSTGQGEKIGWKSSWVEMKTGTLFISNYQVQNIFDLWKINLLPVKTDLGSVKQRQILKQHLLLLSSLTGLFTLLFLAIFSSLLPYLWGIFYPFLDMPEVPPSGLLDSAVPCGGSTGAGWNWLCPAWGCPGHFS